MSEARTAVGYTRLSQSGRDGAIKNQKERIRQYASTIDIELDEIYDDGSYSSGWDGGRDEYQKLKHRIKNEEDVDAVVVRDVSRLGRDFDERMLFLIMLRQNGVELHDENGRKNIEDPMNAAVEAVSAAADDTAKETEIQNAKRAIRERQKNGYDQGRPPFGLTFDANGQYWVRDDDEWEVVQNVLSSLADGLSYRSVEREVNKSPSYSTIRRISDKREMYEQY